MAIVKVLSAETLGILLEGEALSNTSLRVQSLSLRTADGLLTASAVTRTAVTVQSVSGELLGSSWNFGPAVIAFHFPESTIHLNAGSRQAATASWKALRVELQNAEMRFTFSGLLLAGNALPGISLEADATLTFTNGNLSGQAISLRRSGFADPRLAIVWTDTLRQITLSRKTDGVEELALPGLRVNVPANATLSLVLDATIADHPTLALLTTAAAGEKITCRGGLGWMRDSDREVQATPAIADVFEFSATAVSAGTLVLANVDLAAAKLPVFLQQPGSQPLTDSQWSLALRITNPFLFPFLRIPGAGGQFIQLKGGSFGSTDFAKRQIPGTVEFSIGAGALSFPNLKANLRFSWETFALAIDHELGISLRGQRSTAPQQHLGLNWRFETDEAGDEVELFVLATKNYHYQLQLASKARFVVEYTKATKDDPIRFVCQNFALSEKGIGLSAEVTSDPARLNGIDTRFAFAGTRLEIVENKIQDFTLMGSGPLPPDLVGDATADISLQFQQQGDTLKLVAGAAELKGTNLLECKTTHFDFEVNALGLKFVDDAGYHLYFTLSGSATYSPFGQDDDPLQFLSSAKIELVDCPLTGDATVLAKHINFLVEFNEPLEFQFLGAFTFELRAIGFLSAADEFDGDAALQLTGQIMFSPESKDTKSAKVDFHGLLIGAPPPGSLLPRLHLGTLGVEIEYGDAFHLSGEVEFLNTPTEKGFSGEGLLEIKGMPTIAASFSFLRVRLDEQSDWVLAWFIFIEVRKVSFKIPVVEIFLREVGLGFGYRYTLTSIREADQAKNLKTMIKKLRELSTTQGDLSKRDRWAVDLEAAGEDPRWTIVFRALFSQTSASSPIKYNQAGEENLPCVFLFDAVVAVRSDLTFFMAARGWINTNYNDYVTAETKPNPLVTGFVILSARQKRLLAHVASNPDGDLGDRPKVPEFVKKAVKNVQFSATLLIEPGLFHLELGWPNMLRWTQNFGPLKVEFRGGFIFRVTAAELVLGISFQARATMEIRAEISLVVVGARLEASLDASLGARLLAVTSLRSANDMALYAAIGLDVRIAIRLVLWIGFKLGFVKLTKEYQLSFSVGFTAGLELGMLKNGPGEAIGLQGSGTISVAVMGHSLRFQASFSVDPGTVLAARNRTSPYMNLGLEATDVDDVPGIAPVPAARVISPPVTGLDAGQAKTLSVPPPVETSKPIPLVKVAPPASPPAARTGSFVQPDYVVLVMRDPDPKVNKRYFLLMPKGEGERGFLPSPPSPADTTPDFRLKFPAAIAGLQRFHPLTQKFEDAGQTVDISANWNASIAEAIDNQQVSQITLADYLKNAYLLNHPLLSGQDSIAVGDPELAPAATPLEDDRVHHPTDGSYEAAVRGAVEQFQGSPMFKRDPNVEYDQALGNAFSESTSVYVQTRQLNGKETAVYLPDSEHAVHFRGTVVHDLLAGFRAFAKGDLRNADDLKKSIPFQMGLVFSLPADQPPPDWLMKVGVPGPLIQQRNGNLGLAAEKKVVTFNVLSAGFDAFPPRFERVKHYASSNTIALAWDLVWDRDPEAGLTASQKSPEHHLLHYQVRRRALDGSEREVVYTVKNASVVNHGSGNAVQLLRPRFQVVDHFNEESVAQQAALPIEGRAYLYTITPCDLADNLGRPLSLIVTRFPDEPPAVPANGELTVAYQFAARPQPSGPVPIAQEPSTVTVKWQDPVRSDGLTVPVKTHRLIFRRHATLALGSYGLDAATSQTRRGSLPASNARPLPTDIKIDLPVQGSREASFASLTADQLTAAGVFPRGAWRPEAWSVFFQTISANGVPSALAPVKIVLTFTGALGKTEERQPGDLEFLPQPIVWPLLPPEDQQAATGLAHFPLPTGSTFDGTLNGVTLQPHPEETRMIRFRWNQGPSEQRGYPLALHAGYNLLELNIDANTNQTFRNRQRLANALWDVQEVRMLPAADLLLAPNNTLATSQWEAWYPSTVARIADPSQRPAGSEAVYGAWYSWRESQLEWPAPPQGDFPGIHADLAAIVTNLRTRFVVDLQVSPPIQQTDLAGLLQSTAPSADPYGWGLLQRFGLAIALSLRHPANGEVISGAALLQAIHESLPPGGDFRRFLHVELLYQPSRAMSLTRGASSPAHLLGIVQLSLRPAIAQQLKYFAVTVQGIPRENATLQVVAPGECTLLNPLDPASGEVTLPAGTSTRTVQVPLTGQVMLLFRSSGKPSVSKLPAAPAPAVALEVKEFAPTDRRSSYFTASRELLGHSSTGYLSLKAYCEGLNGNTGGGPAISLPADADGLAKLRPDLMAWTARFFDSSGAVTASGRTGPGPWIATAYPRSTAQVFTAPDENGRLTYDYLITDKFAHNFRYYVRPFGRYDLLWRSLLLSPALFPKSAIDPLPVDTPLVDQGALDVVLHRTQPVVAPVVLRSGRLDGASIPGKPSAPGSTWEVIVAQHPEQALAERNQTVFRQLSFRGIAFTLQRQFAFSSWSQALGFPVEPVVNVTPQLPAALAAPDPLDLAKLSDADARTLDLPLRLGSFQQGALVLQWSALPFYYQHRLMLIAQSSSTVSPVNTITQSDFEYRSPTPSARAQGVGSREERVRRVAIPLNRLWDALPEAAQQQWLAEGPEPGRKKPGSLPDPEVVYQLVHLANGNVEVQAEIFLNDPAQKRFDARQLGKVFTVQGGVTLTDDFHLGVSLQQSLAVELLSRYRALPELAHRVTIDAQGKVSAVHGVLRPGEVMQIMSASRAGLFGNRFGTFAATAEISDFFDLGILSAKFDYPQLTTPGEIPLALRSQLTMDVTGTIWRGFTTRQQLAVLRGFRSTLPAHKIHFSTLSAVIQKLESHRQTIAVPYPSPAQPFPADPLPDLLRASLSLALPDPNEPNWRIDWNGVMSDAQKALIEALPGAPAFRSALNRLVAARPSDITLSFSFGETIAMPLEPRVQPNQLQDVFLPGELSAFALPDQGDISFTWLQNAPPPLPFEIYTARVADKFGSTHPAFTAVFANLIDRVKSTFDASEKFFGDSMVPSLNILRPFFVRATSPLNPAEIERLATFPGMQPGQREQLPLALADRRTLENLSQDWFSSVAISAVVTDPSLLPPGLIDFPEPQQCTLVWRGLLSGAQRAALITIRDRADAGFARAIDEILAQPPASATGIATGLAPVGFDQIPAALKANFRVSTDAGRHVAVEWTASTPMLDRDVRALEQWPPMAAFLPDLERIQRFEKPLPIENLSARPRPRLRPAPSQLPPGLASRLTIEPQRLIWTGRLEDFSQLDLLESLTGDAAFDSAIVELLQFLRTPPRITLTGGAPQRPLLDSLPAVLKDQWLIGRAVIRYHGLMTVDEGRDLLAAYQSQPDREALQRLFDASIATGLRGTELLIRARRGSAQPSELVALSGERLQKGAN